jgi:Uma2 family endonuclease
MSALTLTQPTMAPPPAPTLLTPRRITVDEYDRMATAGVFDEPKKIELIDGYLVTKMPKSPEHSFSTRVVFKSIEKMLPPGWMAQKADPIRIPPYDEPEPDVAIVRGTDSDFRHRLPEAGEVGLAVEVSRTNPSADRLQENSYARGGIPVYWIVNLVDRQVEVYTDPGPAGYATRTEYRSGQQVPVVIDGQQCGQIAVDDILP